jgi:hypothetical protein
MPVPKDQFANYAIVSVVESAPNTLTFKKLETGVSMNEKIAWILNRIEYTVSSLLAAQFNADGDAFTFGLAVSASFASAAITEATILDWNQITRQDFGAAATASMIRQPFTKDFSSLPMGGILVPPNPLYIFGQGTSLVGAMTAIARIHYTTLSLTTDQYWELVEARRVLSS